MKRWLFLWLCTCSLWLACSDSSQSPEFHVSSSEFTWDATVREQLLTVATPTVWSARSDVNWCQPIQRTGSKGMQVRLWVSPNLTAQSRTGNLTISSGGQVKIIKLTQPAYTGNVDDYEYVLPVVFHVLYKDEADEQQNVRKNWLASLLAKVNKVYSNNRIGVKFEMAAYDEKGEALEEPGVMRHQVSSESFSPTSFLRGVGEAKDVAGYGQHLRRFINIYVFRFAHDPSDKDTQTLGISNFPLTTTAHPLDSLVAVPNIENYTHMNTPWGVCINNEEIYTLSDRIYRDADVSVTLAHELGHYLGLLHSFSEVGCLYDDACSDTPVSDYMAYREYISQLIDDYNRAYHGRVDLSFDLLATRENCQEAGRTFVADNVMDYSYCYCTVLTTQQRARIRHVLNYVPLVPGPKLVDYGVATNTRSLSTVSPRLSHCPSLPVQQVSVVP